MFIKANNISRLVPRTSLCSLRFYTKYPTNDQIFVHKTGNNYKYSLSPEPSSLPIGYGPAPSDVPAENFKPNDTFLRQLQRRIGSDIQNDFSFILEAGANAGAFMPIYDYREVPRYGRIPEVDNIFGYVQVNQEGTIVPGTYEENSFYRLCNGSGPIRLSDYLYDKLRSDCEAKANIKDQS
ncbi:uncharacterized protein PRCAT00000319001 [Priceomyces carsonii]|uniref:uncharacterized protein n=1 Tax=Priceomyces carsonii TaxID=28549 RepID=UPI002ED88C25|nr:unnamed protein product [Priceomyces carsonii]